MTDTTSDTTMHQSDRLKHARSALEALEDEDGVEDVDVKAEVHTGRPFAAIEIRMNEYGAFMLDPAGSEYDATDPIGAVVAEHALNVDYCTPTTNTTSKLVFQITDPTDGYEVSA